jgi:hypothetical protein
MPRAAETQEPEVLLYRPDLIDPGEEAALLQYGQFLHAKEQR